MNATFSKPAVALLVALALLVLALSALLPSCDLSPSSGGGRKVDPSSYSVSAIGHAGFYDVLRRLGRPVGRATGPALEQVGPHGLLIMAEPNIGRLSSRDDQTLLAAPRLLMVLPKWRGRPDEGRPAWAADLTLHSEKLIATILTRVDDTGGSAAPELAWRVDDQRDRPPAHGTPGRYGQTPQGPENRRRRSGYESGPEAQQNPVDAFGEDAAGGGPGRGNAGGRTED